LGVGRENAKLALRERPDLMKEIREKSIVAWQTKEDIDTGLTRPAGSPADESEDEAPPAE
jgi:hypothetical protein